MQAPDTLFQAIKLLISLDSSTAADILEMASITTGPLDELTLTHTDDGLVVYCGQPWAKRTPAEVAAVLLHELYHHIRKRHQPYRDDLWVFVEDVFINQRVSALDPRLKQVFQSWYEPDLMPECFLRADSLPTTAPLARTYRAVYREELSEEELYRLFRQFEVEPPPPSPGDGEPEEGDEEAEEGAEAASDQGESSDQTGSEPGQASGEPNEEEVEDEQGTETDDEDAEDEQGAKTGEEDSEDGETQEDGNGERLEELLQELVNETGLGQEHWSDDGGIEEPQPPEPDEEVPYDMAEAFEQSLAGDRQEIMMAAMDDELRDEIRSQVWQPPEMQREDLIRVMAGIDPLLWRAPRPSHDERSVPLYVDVSRSTRKYIHWLWQYSMQFADMLDHEVYCFAGELQAVPLNALKEGFPVGKGTDLNLPLRHILQHGWKRALLMTDADGSIDPVLLKEIQCRRISLFVLLTPKADEETFQSVAQQWKIPAR